VSNQQVTTPTELMEAVARVVMAALAAAPQPEPPRTEETPDFLTAGQLARRLGISRETVRRLAIADVLPHTVVCRGSKKTTRRFPRRFADEFAASGLDMTDLAGFAALWRAQVAGAGR
jgi:excisionase family DNA binding protein